MRVFNPSTDSTAAFDLYLVPEDADGTTTYSHIALRVPPDTIANLQDVIKTSFGVTNGKGNLVIQAAGTELLATSRTYNSGGTSGTFGQFVGSDQGINAVGKGDGPVTMLQLASNDAYRTNVGFSEASGHSADVTITLHDGSTGAVIGTPKTYTVKPFSNVQVNKIFEKLGAPSSANAYATGQVTGGVGRITAYATVVDRTTGDAIFVPGAAPSAASAQMIPIVASSPGLKAFWVSDVRVLNAGSSTAQVTLEFRPEKTSPGTFKSVSKTIEPGHVLALDDVLETAFGISNTKGSLRIVSKTSGALLLITSRTYNKTSHGTYGQFVPAVAVGFTGSGHTTVIQMDGKGGFHSNVGICNISGSSITVGYDVKDATGATLGSGSVDLGPYQVEHITHVFKSVGATPTDNARIDFHLDSAGGAFTAYGTLVDDTSADAIYIPAMAY
jgi:hypothetical protein